VSTLPALVRAHVERTPTRPVFTFHDLERSGAETTLTYASLWERAEAYGEALDTPPGGFALIVLPLGTELVAAHLGCMLAGLVPSIHSHPSTKIAREVSFGPGFSGWTSWNFPREPVRHAGASG
jgi:acyl-CoA synthetase (AMP-forming)/AMP-acid ligase II